MSVAVEPAPGRTSMRRVLVDPYSVLLPLELFAAFEFRFVHASKVKSVTAARFGRLTLWLVPLNEAAQFGSLASAPAAFSATPLRYVPLAPFLLSTATVPELSPSRQYASNDGSARTRSR